jgi:hypothetical protein
VIDVQNHFRTTSDEHQNNVSKFKTPFKHALIRSYPISALRRNRQSALAEDRLVCSQPPPRCDRFDSLTTPSLAPYITRRRVPISTPRIGYEHSNRTRFHTPALSDKDTTDRVIAHHSAHFELTVQERPTPSLQIAPDQSQSPNNPDIAPYMSTAQITASPRAPRAQPRSPAQVPHNGNAGRQSQRKPRGNRAYNNYAQQNGVGASPSKYPAEPAVGEGAAFSGEEAQIPSGPRNMKKHTQGQPSIDRVFSPSDSEAIPINPSATPAKIQAAYAGPTFHASPAPSALPIPTRFLSRSVPSKGLAGPPTPPPEDSSDSASPSPSHASPSRPPIAVPPRNDDSPLDLLFKADKAERAKNIHGSPVAQNIFNQAHAGRPQHFKHDSYHSTNGIFPIELDGESKNAHMSPPPFASPAPHRSVTDPNKVPQLKDVYQQPSGNDVMQDLFSRLSMSQKKPSATPPRPNVQPQTDFQFRQTPSPFHDGRPLVRSTSGPTTPQAQPTNQDSSEFFYGNTNLSPLFKAAKGDTPKRNSGLRTEITAESPMMGQGAFQGFPSVPQAYAPPAQVMDPHTFSRDHPGSCFEGPANARREFAPPVQPYQQSPNSRKRTPGRQPHQPRADFHPGRGNMNGPGPRPGNATAMAPPAPVSKPVASMMSFVPASVAAKGRKASAPAAVGTSPQMKTSTPSGTLALEQDLKRLLNFKPPGDASSVR